MTNLALPLPTASAANAVSARKTAASPPSAAEAAGRGAAVRQERIETLVLPLCAAHGVELVQLQLHRIKSSWVLRLVIDRAGSEVGGTAPDNPPPSGVTLADCTQLSRDVASALEVHDFFGLEGLRLEVSSPGIERPLVKLSDFERFRGYRARVETVEAVDGRRKHQGIIEGTIGNAVGDAPGGGILLADNARVLTLPFATIRKAHLSVLKASGSSHKPARKKR